MTKLSLLITDIAKNDIQKIVSYISVDNKSAAKAVAVYLYAACNKLIDFPELGVKRPDFTYEEYRFLVLKFNYILAYKIMGDNIIISRVLVANQDIKNLL